MGRLGRKLDTKIVMSKDSVSGPLVTEISDEDVIALGLARSLFQFWSTIVRISKKMIPPDGQKRESNDTKMVASEGR